jgi:xylulose-5-phosphate/fructose-6-phosphate phosphoketolase
MTKITENSVAEVSSSAQKIGELLARELQNNSSFYFFSPDETTSNKFDQVFEVEKRAWGDLKQEDWDLPESPNGRVVEMLSENVLFSMMTGHLMGGESAMMGSYEAFYSIITAQLLQHMKFLKQADKVPWRKPLPAANLLSTSTCWRQDHNGFTHQSPALISTLLSVPSNKANCLFPIDSIAAEQTYNFMINSKNVVNLATFDKNERPCYTDANLAKFEFENGGAAIYEDISDENPDIILAACGDIVAHEVLECMKILRADLPDLKLRFININSLSYRAIGTTENKLTKERFLEMFDMSKPIIANFHGYPETLENILENYTARGLLRVHGFNEEGSTTTPFEMLRKNAASRYDLAIDVAKFCKRQDLVAKYQDMLEQNHAYAVKNGEDLIK